MGAIFNVSVLEMEVLAEVIEASKLSLFVQDLILHREHPKCCHKTVRTNKYF